MIDRRTDKIKSIFYFLDLRPNNEVFIVKIDIQGFECKVGNLTVKFLKNRIVSANYVHVIPSQFTGSNSNRQKISQA